MRLKLYEKMKDSGVDWIGEIPEKWEVCSMKYFLKTPVADGPHETPVFQDNGIPFLSVDSIQNNKLILENPRYISKKDHEKFSKKCKPQKHDILLGKAASVGKVAFVETKEEFNIWSPLAVIRLKEQFEPKFYFYYMISTAFQNEVSLNVNFNTQGNIGMRQIENLLFLEPPSNVQKNIIKFLDEIIEKIELKLQKNQKMIKLLKEKQQSMISQLVTKGFDPSVTMKDSGVDWIGKIPEHWEIKQIGKTCKSFVPGRYKPQRFDGEIPWITTADLKSENVGISKKGLGISLKEIKEIGTKIIPKNSVIMTCVGEIGLSAITKNEVVVNQQLHGFQPKSDILSNFLVKVIKIQKDFLQNIANSTVIKYLNKENCESILIPVPTLKEQKQIIDFIEKKSLKIESLITNIEFQIEKLKEIKQSLIYLTVTGKIDINFD